MDVLNENETVRARYKAYPENHGALGRKLEISPKAHITVNKPGYQMTNFTPTIEVLIGIGKDHVAHLIMDEDAWKAFKEGEPVNIDTLKEFKKKFL